MSEAILLRVLRVRRRSARATVFSGLAIDEEGRLVAGAPRYAVTLPSRRAVAEVEQGQWWRLTGKAVPTEYAVDGYRVIEHRITATDAELRRPCGEHIIQLLSTSPAFPGIGEVKARRLWERLGESLYDSLDQADADTLAGVVGAELAQGLLAGWRQYGDAAALRWFQRVGLSLCLSRKLLDVYEGEALAAVQADPYRLLAFGMNWIAADTLARQHFGLPADDERRLAAAVEAVMYQAFDAGHTCCARQAVEAALARLVGKAQAATAISFAQAHHLVQVSGDRFHALGPRLIEQGVATALRARLGREAVLADPPDVEAFLTRFERDEAAALGMPAFTLNAAQREAVHAVARLPLVLITGSAGVGKTTVLKAVEALLEQSGQHIYAMALSGRAAKRLTEATHRPAMTIAGFLRNVAPHGLPESSVLVVDEASMLDILLAYRLLNAIPASCRLVFIGDPFQLPPVGPGLTLHALVSVPTVPRVELTEVRRFGGAIATGARAVRDGQWPSLPDTADEALAFLPCAPDALADAVLRLYLADPVHTQVLTFTRERGVASAKALNGLCQSALAGTSRRLFVWSEERERREDTGLRLGEPVLCTRNLHEWGLQNGSLGHIETIEDPPQPLFGADGEPKGLTLAWVRWDDGERRPVTEEVLDALELGYAVTVHKAQGSQFPRVLIPVYAARNLDRTMLYTAMTRAKTQVILVGDVEVAHRAVEAPPHASHRQVALAELMTESAACS
ncbi:AAA family ATPase [Aromatoleum petrolei]|uniref:AAA family ATPase n=1 Tax=Aromatoleum petrolei TaxID=76116 RepID=A0ABX1MHN6_9RHOO|nr:AAA family ATPase [Aromatoleum petrolei]NMF87457.1 AAA family ATPase [Aromatoleum petrolei]QTQ35825.1 RecD helicase-like protein helix-hairpin-helix domain containing protein [Aromatoleum petrolei]